MLFRLSLSSRFLLLCFISFLAVTGCKKSNDDITDGDGNVYTSVVIGTQEWLLENLKTTTLNDGTPILHVPSISDWAATTGSAYCWYENEISNKEDYGALYNWKAVSTGKLCPKGWHVPTNAEWTVLTDYLGGTAGAAYKVKETGTGHWLTTTAQVTNSSGFTALPGGYRDYSGNYDRQGSIGYWWTATEENSGNAWFRSVFENYDEVYGGWTDKSFGYSVRCIKN